MSPKTSTRAGKSVGKAVKKAAVRRTPRTIKVNKTASSKLPSVISESFNLKNFDIVGKIDDMRSLTKELSVMARQLEQWMGVFHTVGTAFKDNGVLRDVMKSLSSISTSGKVDQNIENVRHEVKQEHPQHQAKRQTQRQPSFSPFPFLFGEEEESEEPPKEETQTNNQTTENTGNSPNIFEIIKNPAFQEIISKLFLQKK